MLCHQLPPSLSKNKKNTKRLFKEEGMSYKEAEHSKSKITAVFDDDAREYLADSGASFHLVSKETLSDQERSTIFKLRHPIPCQTANGEVLITKKS